MNKHILAVAILSALTSTAMAEGIYGLVDIGQSTTKNACAGVPAGVSCNESGTAFRFGGGYQVNQNLAVEASYAMLGNNKASAGGVTAEIKPAALQLSAVGSFPLNQEFSLFAKAGLSRISADMSSTGSATQSTTKTGLGYGFGVQYDVTKQMGVRAQYESLGKLNDTITDFDVSMFSAGLIFKF